MTRSILAVLAGLIAAFVVVLGVELIGMQIFPQPATMNPMDPESVRAHLSEIHAGSFIFVIIAWSLAAFAGPAMARRIARQENSPAPAIVIALFAILCIYNLITVPTPKWMIPLAVIFVGMFSMLGFRTRLGTQRVTV